MFLALAWRAEVIYHQKPNQSGDPDPSDVYDALLEIKEASKGLREELVTEFKSFAENMTDNNSKALIDALESVIRDFNTKLNEQFGENFKQLKVSMDNLLVWQENYKQHLEEMEKRWVQAIEATERSEQALEKVATHTEKIPEHLQALSELLAQQKTQMDDLETRLRAFAAMKQQAVEAFPFIEENIQRMTSQFSEKVLDASREINTAAVSYRSAFEELNKNYSRLGDGISDSLEALSKKSESVIDSIGVEVNRILEKQTVAFSALGVGFDRLGSDMDRMAENIAKKAEEIGKRTADVASQQQKAVESMAIDMQKALTEGVTNAQRATQGLVEESLKELKGFTTAQVDALSTEFEGVGQELASISQKLAENWQGVASALPDHVHLEDRGDK